MITIPANIFLPGFYVFAINFKLFSKNKYYIKRKSTRVGRELVFVFCPYE